MKVGEERLRGEGGVAEPRQLYFDLLMAAFVTILLLSNVIGAGKVSSFDLPWFGATAFCAGILFFPASYVIGDILSEAYGFARARRCIRTGLAPLLFMAATSRMVVALPASPVWAGQTAYEQAFAS